MTSAAPGSRPIIGAARSWSPPPPSVARRPRGVRIATATVPLPSLRALTGLRFVAAFHVLLLHTALGFVQSGPAAVRNVVRAGTVSVGLFFVLSGFILAYQYLEPARGGALDRRAFWWARVARVYPVYLFALLFALPPFAQWAAAALAGDGPAVGAAKVAAVLGTNATLTQAWLPPAVGPLNPPGWSLSVEAIFYLLFPFVAVRAARLTARRAALAAGLAWLLALAVPTLYLIAEARGLVPDSARDGSLSLLKFNPLLRFPEFLIGVLAGRIFLERRARAAAPISGAALSIGAAAATLGVLAASGGMPAALLEGGALAPLFAVLVYGLAHGDGPLAWLLARPAMVLLGQASYALYLLHMRLAEYVVAIAYRLVGPMPAPALYAVYLAVAVGISVAVLKLLEEPAREAIRRAVHPRPGGRPARSDTRTPPTGVPLSG